MSLKKYVNTHYPGIKIDPHEGKTPIHAEAALYFNEQLQCLGPDILRGFLKTSIVVLGANPLATQTAKKTIEFGIGRIGVVGDMDLSGAHALGLSKSPSQVLTTFSKWIREQKPWVDFEPYKGTSLDRNLEDIVRGFDVIIDCRGQKATLEFVRCAPTAQRIVSGFIEGQIAWAGVLQQSTMEPPKEKTLINNENSLGLYYPLLDYISNQLSVMALNLVLFPKNVKPSLELVDASQTPWSIQRSP